MSRDSGGTYTRVDNSFSNPISGTAIDPANATSLFDDIETEMTDSLCRSGKGSMLANLSMGGFNITTASAVQIKGSASGFTVINAAAAASGTVTLPAATDTLVGKATTDILTNKTFDTAGTGNVFKINGSQITANSGSGSNVLASTPTLVTPNLTGTTTAVSIAATGSLLSSSATAGIGYATGAGGTVTQGTSKSTTVVLNTVTGQITMNGAALGASTIVTFTLTNSAIAAGDVLILNHVSAGTAGSYTFNAQCGSGSAAINVRNVTGGSLSEALVLGFAVIKGVTS